MRSKSVAAVVWSLVLVGLMIVLVACDSKEPPQSGAKDKPAAAQPAAPAPAPADAPAPAQGKLNAAELFTKADAEAILGKPVGAPAVQGDGTITSNVTYIASDLSSVNLFVRASTTAQTFEDAQAASKTLSGVDPVPVAGLGDRAYWAGGKLNQLNVHKGQYWLIIMVPSGKERTLDIARQVAEKALPRVP